MAFSISTTTTTTAITGSTLISKAKNPKLPSPMIVTFCHRDGSPSFDDLKFEGYCFIKSTSFGSFFRPDRHGKRGGSGNPFGGLKSSCYEVKSIDDGLYVRMDLQGIAKEDVEISVVNDVVYVKGEGEKQSEHDSHGRSYEGSLELSPGRYKTDEIKSDMKNGVLRMVIPARKVGAVADD